MVCYMLHFTVSLPFLTTFIHCADPHLTFSCPRCMFVPWLLDCTICNSLFWLLFICCQPGKCNLDIAHVFSQCRCRASARWICSQNVANSWLAIFVMSINRALIICHDKSHVYARVLDSVSRCYRLRFQEGTLHSSHPLLPSRITVVVPVTFN